MSHAPVPADRRAAGPGLPEGLAGRLRAAFADEVAERLPRLRAGLLALASGDERVDEQLVRDVHTLASSATVVGAPELAQRAREAERALEAGAAAGLPAAGPRPGTGGSPAALAALAAVVELAGRWRP